MNDALARRFKIIINLFQVTAKLAAHFANAISYTIEFNNLNIGILCSDIASCFDCIPSCFDRIRGFDLKKNGHFNVPCAAACKIEVGHIYKDIDAWA